MSEYDFWTHQGGREFGLVPAGILDTDVDTPICLQRGNSSFGETHVQLQHGSWVAKHANSVADLVWKKCRQSGQIFSTEEAGKVKIAMRITPDALLVLRYIRSRTDAFFTVVTLYPVPSHLDGARLGRYVDSLILPTSSPSFNPPPPLPKPHKVQVFVKKRRAIEKPEA